MGAAPKAVTPSVNGWNAEFLDAQYERFRQDPGSVPEELRAFFQGFELGRSNGQTSPTTTSAASEPSAGEASPFQAAVGHLIESYRTLGHVAAKLDPFGRENDRPEPLNPSYHGLSEADLDRTVDASQVGLGDSVTLRQVIEHLEQMYCGSIGVEVMHLEEREEREWLLDRFERGVERTPLSRGQRAHLLEQLLRAEAFEKFLGKRYPGDKRFSLEGAESLIPLLDHLIEHAADLGVQEIVVGMAHRGRLNVLNNILGKTHEQIFTEFEDIWEDDFVDGGGDVKYHRGYSGERLFGSGKKVHLAMASNPSHLEAVNPVVLGRCRAKQRLRNDLERSRVIPLLIHGDAAISGQGVVAECLNLSQLEGYTTGGCAHVVVNNQIGFTTLPEDGRSTRYCTDIAKSINAPVLHVNAEDPEAVLSVAHFAIEYRQKFKKDIFIDLICYRRYGHNEQDEASFTQPIIAGLIKRKPSVLKVYAERLLAEGVINEQDMTSIRDRIDEALDKAQRMAREEPRDPTIDPGSARWTGISSHYTHEPVDTGVPMETLREVCAALGRVPDGFNINPKLKKLLKERGSLPDTGKISYADAESLAYGTLLLEGTAVRLSGQDCRRGTFSHRHGVFRDVKSAKPYVPLNNIRELGEPGTDHEPGTPGQDGRPRQARLCIYDSPLSEFSVMGFDYGYSLADPNMLVLWEAQFGDFNNGAQVMIDQFIASAETKWHRWSGLVLLLPHGYEGMGPEHSSARLERFLQLCGDSNMQVVYPTTGAQTFHLLRRQVHRPVRKPLVVMTPKSMLRVPTSTIDELTEGSFMEVLDDPRFGADKAPPRTSVDRVILCSGKIYHELAERCEKTGRNDTALVRIEQLYPFHTEMVAEVLARYPKKAELIWVQEEPRNMGAFLYVADRLREEVGVTDLRYIGRATSATPATGSKKRDREQQEGILSRAIGPLPAKDSSNTGKDDDDTSGDQRSNKAYQTA